jgi:hypothetical protein
LLSLFHTLLDKHQKNCWNFALLSSRQYLDVYFSLTIKNLPYSCFYLSQSSHHHTQTEDKKTQQQTDKQTNKQKTQKTKELARCSLLVLENVVTVNHNKCQHILSFIWYYSSQKLKVSISLKRFLRREYHEDFNMYFCCGLFNKAWHIDVVYFICELHIYNVWNLPYFHPSRSINRFRVRPTSSLSDDFGHLSEHLDTQTIYMYLFFRVCFVCKIFILYH